MYSAKIFLALETILDWDLIFLNSSQANQNSRFSSLNSVRRKALKAASPSVGDRDMALLPHTDREQPHETLSSCRAQTTSLHCPKTPLCKQAATALPGQDSNTSHPGAESTSPAWLQHPQPEGRLGWSRDRILWPSPGLGVGWGASQQKSCSPTFGMF